MHKDEPEAVKVNDGWVWEAESSFGTEFLDMPWCNIHTFFHKTHLYSQYRITN